MDMTSIKVHDDCILTWNELKNENKYRYIIFNFSKDLLYIIVEKTAPPEKTYEDFLNDLPDHDARFAIYHYEYQRDDGKLCSKFIFITYIPDDTPLRRKILIACSKRTARNAFPGLALEIAGASILTKKGSPLE